MSIREHFGDGLLIFLFWLTDQQRLYSIFTVIEFCFLVSKSFQYNKYISLHVCLNMISFEKNSEIHNNKTPLGNIISLKVFYMYPNLGHGFFNSDMLINKPGCYYTYNFCERQIQNGRFLFLKKM